MSQYLPMRGGHPLGSRVLSLGMFGVCLVVVVTIGGCSREKPMATPTATPESQEATVESSPAPVAVSTPVRPTTTYYTVQAGDTLWAIAGRFGVTIQSLVEVNELSDPERLQAGQEIVIPTASDMATDEPPPQEASLGESGSLESQREHTVTVGDSLWSIALRYATTVDEIATLNGLNPDEVLAVGQRLLIP